MRVCCESRNHGRNRVCGLCIGMGICCLTTICKVSVLLSRKPLLDFMSKLSLILLQAVQASSFTRGLLWAYSKILLLVSRAWWQLNDLIWNDLGAELLAKKPNFPGANGILHAILLSLVIESFQKRVCFFIALIREVKLVGGLSDCLHNGKARFLSKGTLKHRRFFTTVSRSFPGRLSFRRVACTDTHVEPTLGLSDLSLVEGAAGIFGVLHRSKSAKSTLIIFICIKI